MIQAQLLCKAPNMITELPYSERLYIFFCMCHKPDKSSYRNGVPKQNERQKRHSIFAEFCGKESGIARSEMAEQVLRFESELYHAGKISARLLAATLILSNKFIDKNRLRALWEEIKMLDILEIAREEGMKEGKLLGIQEGKLLGIQEGKLLSARGMLTDALIERFGAVPVRVLEHIGAVQNTDALKILLRQVLKCQNICEFESVMQQIL